MEFEKPSDSGFSRVGSAEDRAPVDRDQWDRYVLPDPYTRVSQSWTRATTFAKALADTYSLQEWNARVLAKGIATTPELVMAAAAQPLRDHDGGSTDKKAWSAIVEEGVRRGGGKTRSVLGTAVHAFTERLDQGEPLERLRDLCPDPYKRDILAYAALKERFGLQVNPQYLERVICNPLAQVAGTFDKIYWWCNPVTGEWELIIGDLKTGRDLQYGWLEIALQMWLYANAPVIWSPEAEQFEAMPSVRKDRALVVHCPLDGTATLYVIDLTELHELIPAVLATLKHRKLAKKRPVALGSVVMANVEGSTVVTPPLPAGPTTVIAPAPAAVPDWQPVAGDPAIEINREILPEPGEYVPTDRELDEMIGRPVPDVGGDYNGPVALTTTVSVGAPICPDPWHTFPVAEGVDPAKPCPSCSAGTTAHRQGKLFRTGEGVQVEPQGLTFERDSSDDLTFSASTVAFITADQPPAGPTEAELAAKHGPLKKDGERGCGACGRKGHKRGNAKCPGKHIVGSDLLEAGNQAAREGHYDPQAVMDRASIPTAQQAADMEAIERTGSMDLADDGPPEGQFGQAENDEPAALLDPKGRECPGVHGDGWTMVKSAEQAVEAGVLQGTYVCATCGRPSAATRLQLDIDLCPSRAELNLLRAGAVSRGIWTNVHEIHGVRRYGELPEES
jgi:hypothetical protein